MHVDEPGAVMQAQKRYQSLRESILTQGAASGKNIVAFSGGVDSSLVAHALYDIFPEHSIACIGVSASLASEQLDRARAIASQIGIPLHEVETKEGGQSEYIANEGESCYFCKTELYSTMQTIYQQYREKNVVLYNGTNAEDLTDPTRVGLKAADEFHVVSPLRTYTKREIRELAQYVGLPNWNDAAAPCLRSRLQFGVHATEENLRKVERAERYIRNRFELDPTINLRVRLLSGSIARIETDTSIHITLQLHEQEITEAFLPIGFSSVVLRPFRSGSMSYQVE